MPIKFYGIYPLDAVPSALTQRYRWAWWRRTLEMPPVADTERVAAWIALKRELASLDQGCLPAAPSRANRLEQRPLDEHLYASRNLVERFFCRINQFLRVATRYDKLSEQLSSFVALSAAFIWTCWL
ncbi:hypothetical protein [Paraburkholderia xenovorans]|uniref:hypothetical protein n=1 Tax=Paraburkholderia xenovorans TaxID=36873 RepID=UPI0038BA2748